MFKFPKLPKLLKKPTSILTEDDKKELISLERESYMKEARKLMEERGIQKAKMELTIKQKKEEDYL